MVTLCLDSALKEAKKADERIFNGVVPRALEGLPVAIKDLHMTKGLISTEGSRIYKDRIPDYDSLIVSRLKEAGAIVIGKSNTPEFGAGSQTFNDVFGPTLNPYDRTKMYYKKSPIPSAPTGWPGDGRRCWPGGGCGSEV